MHTRGRKKNKCAGQNLICIFLDKLELTDQIVGRDNDAAHKQYGTSNAIVAPENQVVDDRLVDEIAHLYEAANGRDQSEKRHRAIGLVYDALGRNLICAERITNINRNIFNRL